MINIIVPLAGPDIYLNNNDIRPLHLVNSNPMILDVLKSRVWIKDEKSVETINYIFILRKIGKDYEKLTSFLKKNFNNSKFITLSNLSQGALFTALCGSSMIKDFSAPIIIDLGDISCNLRFNPSHYFKDNKKVDGLIPYFKSSHPKYSYLEKTNEIVYNIREKEVISNFASVGIYIYRNFKSFVNSIIYAIENKNICSINDSFFVAPSMNSIIKDGKEVHTFEVKNVRSHSLNYHHSDRTCS